MAKCFICGKRAKAKLSDGSRVCSDCWHQVGLTEEDLGYGSLNESKADVTGVEFKEVLDAQKRLKEIADVPSTVFVSAYPLGYIGFNDDDSFLALKYKNPDTDYFFTYELFPYSSITRIDVSEQQKMTSTSDGLGRAVAGGLLFGGIGAIIGSMTARQESMIRNYKTISIDFDEGDGPRRVFIPGKDEIIDKLAIIVGAGSDDVPNESQASSDIDEILKYKELLDAGVLTEDEFQLKKRQLLGID